MLAKLRSTYINTKSYSDNAILKQRGVSRLRGTLIEMPFTHLSLLFARPNRYSITYEDAIPGSQGSTKYRVASDGKRVRSAASQLPEQIHEAIAPRETTTDNLTPEPELKSAILQVALENLFPQLVMLLTRDAEKPIFPRSTRLQLLPDDKIDGATCYRLSLTEPEGVRVLWIDKDKLLLRRMEIPIEGQREALDPAKQFTSFSVDLDFENVTLDAEFADAAVTLEVPEGGRLVRRFIPPPPAGPSDKLGRPVKEFKFTDAEGNEVTPALLAGKIVVLDFWATDCAPCKANTPVLEAAYQQLKDQNDVAFYAVSTDPKGLATPAVEKTLQSWGATFPLLRDLDKNAFYELEVHATPTLMVIGPDQRLEAAHLGALADADDLVAKVKLLRDGGDLVEQAKQDYAKELKQHAAIFAAATLEESLVEAKPAPPEAAARKLPENLHVEELWSSKLANVGEPTGIAVLTSADGALQEVLVVDGGRAVVRYDATGRYLGRVDLPEHAEKTGGFIRTMCDGEGNRTFLVSGVGWQQIYLYDKDWKMLFAFPDEPHSGIGDARFIVLKANATPSVLVGYWGGFGVQSGSLEGQRMWVNRYLDHVWNLSPGAVAKSGEQSIWCTSTRGTVHEIDAEGKSQREFAVAGQTMISLAPPDNVSRANRCGLGLSKPGHYEVVAFDKDGEVQWRDALPLGEYAGIPPLLKRAKLPEHEDALIAAGPDGSLHFVASSGELISQFNYGQHVADYAVAENSDGPILFVSAGNRLTAWRITADSAP